MVLIIGRRDRKVEDGKRKEEDKRQREKKKSDLFLFIFCVFLLCPSRDNNSTVTSS